MPPRMTMAPNGRRRNQAPWMVTPTPPLSPIIAAEDLTAAGDNKLLIAALAMTFACAISLPFFVFGPFVFYIVVIGLVIWYLPITVPMIMLVKLAWYFVLLFVHVQNTPTLLNIASLIVADLYSLALATIFMSNGIDKSIKYLSYTCGAIIFAGFLIGLTIGSSFEIADPIETFSYGRMLILTKPYEGHSMLIETSTIILAASLAGFIGKRLLFITIPVASAGLLAANNATSIGIFGIIWGISTFERLLFYRLTTLAHVILIGICIYIIFDPDLLYDTLYFIRFDVLGQDITMYRGDFTSGRAQLTALLIDLANDEPIFGVGHEHNILEYGIRTITGAATGATSESPLRLAAKYGWPTFGFMIVLVSMPLFVGLTQKSGKVRNFFVSIGYAIILASSTNSGFSTGQSATYFLFGPIIWLAILWRIRSNGEGWKDLGTRSATSGW